MHPLLLPPDSCSQMIDTVASPTRSSAATARAWVSRLRPLRSYSRAARRSHGARSRQQVESLEDEAQLLVADRGELVLAEPSTRAPSSVYDPTSGIETPEQCISVDLPEPSAHDATSSPG